MRTFFLLLALLTPFSAAFAEAPRPPSRQIRNDGIVVDGRFTGLPENVRRDLENGIGRELEVHVELRRVWNWWLDEFVDGQILIRNIKYDVLTREFLLSSVEGRYLKEKKVSTMKEAEEWILTVRNVPVTSAIGRLPAGMYYLRLVLKARRSPLPGLFSTVLFFLPETDFIEESRGEGFSLPP